MPGLNSTRAEAAQRSSHLAVDSYDLTLDLTKGDEIFESKTIINSLAINQGMKPF